MKNRPITLFGIAAILILACSCPLVSATGVTPTGTAAPGGSAPTSSPSPSTGATPLPTSTIPLASPNGQALNCRSGPGVDWSVVIVLNPGQTVEIVGKSPDGSWWYVKNPSLPGNFCWIAASFTTTAGDLGGIQIVAVPSPAAPSVGVVTAVSVSINPDKIQVPGCIGPIQPETVSGNITVNGPVKLDLHFETQQNGSLSNKSLNFKSAGSKGVDDSFTPPLVAGKYKVELIIKSVDTSGMNSVVYYKISC
jgi:Bacterial SH3 domain